jgi:hypothetical protein
MNLISGSNSLSYGIVPSAPASLSPVDIESWRGKVTPEVKHYFQERFNHLVAEYNKLVDEYQTNQLMYESDISFTPVIGEQYHLYERNNGTRFISMLAPSYTKWGGYMGTFKLKAQYTWERIKGEL